MFLSGSNHVKEHYLYMFQSILFHLFLFDSQNKICIVNVTDYDLIGMQ